MKLQEALEIPRGITSVIGGGGKTTLLSVLARELACGGATVALTTSTHFLPFEGMPALSGPGEWDAVAGPVACFASPTEEGKLTVPACGIVSRKIFSSMQNAPFPVRFYHTVCGRAGRYAAKSSRRGLPDGSFA